MPGVLPPIKFFMTAAFARLAFRFNRPPLRFFLLAAALALAGCQKLPPWWPQWWPGARQQALPEGIYRANGRLELTRVDVAAKYPGRLREAAFQEGERVQAGQVLAAQEDGELQAKLAQARAALARASAPAGAGGAGSSSCMKTHHGQPAGADWASGWKGAPSWASPATATHSMPCAVHSSTRSPAAAFSRAGCAAAQSTSSAAASAQKRRAETGRRHSTPGRENARIVKKSPENCNKTWKKVAQCRGMRAKNPASASCLQAARVRRLEPVQRLAVRGLHEPRAPAGRSQGSRAPKPALFVLFTPAAQLARRHLKTPPRAAGAACSFLDSR